MSENQRVLIVQIATLREMQLEDIRSATFTGWKLDAVIAHDERERKISELVRQLKSLGKTA